MAGFKLPLDAFVLAVPVLYACTAMGAMVYHTSRHDPEQSTAAFYEESNLQHELAASKAYIHNPTKRFFDARVAGRQTWGVFENDFSRQH